MAVDNRTSLRLLPSGPDVWMAQRHVCSFRDLGLSKKSQVIMTFLLLQHEDQ